jgi:hypothetical protein
MKKYISKLLIGVGIGACLILSGCGNSSSNNIISAGTYKIIGTDSSDRYTYVLINVQGAIKEAKVPMGTPIEDIDAVIGSYAIVNNDKEVVNIKKEGNK